MNENELNVERMKYDNEDDVRGGTVEGRGWDEVADLGT